MKCKYCNADVEQEAQFCPNCGKDFSKFKKCIKCGELLDKDAVFCPHCGAEQPRKKRTVEKETSSKKWLWVIIGLFLLGAIGAGIFYYIWNNMELSGNGNAFVETGQTVSNKEQSKEYVEKELKVFMSDYINMNDNIEGSLSSDFNAVIKKRESTPNLGEWDLFGLNSSATIERFDIKNLTEAVDNKTKATVLLYINNEGEYEEETCTIFMVFENGKWVVDEIDNVKKNMKSVIKEENNQSSNSFVGKVYKGSGNGGGLYTKMTITFHDKHQCTCVSDWYQAYSSPKSIKGTYDIKNNKVIVICKDNDGTEYKFDFDIKSNGRVIGFDNSDPDMGGTMGNDYMSLEIQ